MDQVNDWFDVKAMVRIGDLLIPFIRLKKNILDRNRNWVLPDGSVVLLPESWFAQYAGLFEFGEETDSGLRIHRQHHGLFDDHPLLTGDFSHRLPEQKRAIYSTGTELAELEQPDTLQATLRDYQLHGLSWLWNLRKNGLGACLADDMGLGKTIQIIALLMHVKQHAGATEPAVEEVQPDNAMRQLNLFELAKPEVSTQHPSLIVMAPSLIHNWKNELHKFAPDLKVWIHAGQKRLSESGRLYDADVVLTTYGVVRNDIDLLSQIDFSTIVLDESQLIKNMRSVTYQRVRQLRGGQRIVMTGTPVENSLSDLWSQLSFLQPGLLGSYAWFKKEFILPIEKYGVMVQLEKLRKVIQPFILRRTKEEVAPELPQLTQSEHICEMDAIQRAHYEEKKSAYRNILLEQVSREGIQKSQFLILRGLMQLRKIAIHPRLDDPEYMGSSTKFEQVLERLSVLEAEGKKVLMFSQFVKHLDLYKEHFLRRNIPFSILTGKIPMQDRAEVLRNFDQSNGFRVFLIQLRTGGSGLNLTQADYVFLLDPWWNPAAEAQAISRSHRIGQHRPVFAWRFITKDTIEEKIMKLQARKSKLANDIIGTGNQLGAISKEELEELFS
jgi:SNF2 family DNA or RNA helicase